MSTIVFVTGRPGSGKSVAIRRMIAFAEDKGFSTDYLGDYPILLKMFQQDCYSEHKQFRQTDYGGFEVCEFSVLDIALKQLEKDMIAKEKTQLSHLIFVEFARQGYEDAFKLFNPILLRDAYFLFIESELDTCIERIYRRVYEPKKPDHHFVSEYIMRTYYDEDDWLYMENKFEQRFATLPNHVKTIHNNDIVEILEIKSGKFIEAVFSDIEAQIYHKQVIAD